MTQGICEEWLKLPFRRCDNCGKRYKPTRPVISPKKGFCTRPCNDQFHKAGGAFKKVKGMMDQELAKLERSGLFKGRLEKLESRIAALELRQPKA